jgi:hypothetical protein
LLEVKSPLNLLIEVISTRLPVENVFKREAIMFGRIACPQLDKMVAAFEALGNSVHLLSPQLHSIATGFFSHIDYLRKHHIIFDEVPSADTAAVDFLNSDSEFASLMTVENRIAPWALEAIQNAGLDDLKDRSNRKWPTSWQQERNFRQEVRAASNEILSHPDETYESRPSNFSTNLQFSSQYNFQPATR